MSTKKKVFQHFIAGLITAVSMPMVYRGINSILNIPEKRKNLCLGDIEEEEYIFDDED